LNKAKNGVGQISLHQHIAREELALGINLATATNLNNLFGRHDNVLDLVRKPLLVCLIQNRLSYLLLEIGIGVDNVPTHCHKKCLPSPSDSDADSKNQIDDPRHELICSKKEQCRQSSEHQNHHRRNQRFAPRWPSYLRRFRPHLLQKREGIRGLGRHLPLLSLLVRPNKLRSEQPCLTWLRILDVQRSH